METASQSAIAPARPTLFVWPLVLAGIWIAAALVGMWFLWRHASTPGAGAQPPAHWPLGTAIQPDPQHATLLMFVHPQCPCTRASVGELEKIIAQCQGKVTPCIVVYKPSHSAANWEKTESLRSAAAIPGAKVISDTNGAEAKRFHVITSGQTLLYDAGGELLFSGGVTSARGHAGDSAGEDAVVGLLTSGAATCRETPVFGCPIITTSNTN